MKTADQLASEHWNETPLFLTDTERYTTYPWLYEAAEFRHHAGEKVLEVGCGTGCDLLQFAMHGAIATGVDITDRHLELARQRVGHRATVVKSDARSLPFPDNSFDYVYSHGVLHHLDEPQAAVREIMRVLRPGGKFNIQLYAKWSYFILWRTLQHGSKWKLYIENSTRPVHIDLYTASQMRRLLGGNVRIEKHHCKPFEFMAPLWGGFIVGKGTKRP